VHLSDGSSVTADERYLHDSILLPKSQLVAGYTPIMPSYSGQLSEEDVIALIDYIKSLSPSGRSP
jgi:cytochrome c oxidase subunit II